MKILQLIPYFTPKRGGDVNVCYNLSKQLAKGGRDVTIITTDFEFDEIYAKSLEFLGIKVLSFHCIANNFKEREGIEDKFLISYAGILSPYQGIDNILDTAKALQDHDDIIFYIAGDGSERQHLKERIQQEGIGNVNLLPFLPRAEYFNLVNSSDVSFVSLDERMRAPCLPGKTINLMACGQPIIAMVALESETARVIGEAGCGIVVQPGDGEGICSSILRLKEDASLREAMGSNGRRYLERHMSLEKNVALYEEIFCTLAGGEGLARRPIPSRSEDAPGVGHHGW